MSDPSTIVQPPLLDQIEALWPLDGWKVERLEEFDSVVARYEASGHQWVVYGRADDVHGLVAVYSLFPRACPPERREAAWELIARINDDLLVGNFEYSFDRDEIRFKTSLDVVDSLTREAWRALVSANVLIVERYYPAVAAVLAGEAEPGAAVAAIEG